MSITMASVQNWAGQVQATLTALPSELEQAAPTGQFASVLQQVSATLSAGPAAATQGSSATGSTATSGTTTSTAGATGTRSTAGTPFLALASSPAGGAGGTSLGQQAVSLARSSLGTPYVWGGESPTGFDCSGLVQYVYRKLGITLPRTTYTQVKVGTPVPSLAQAQPGDLVFFAGSDGTTTNPGHVGIYIGNGQMIDAPYTGADVRVDPVGNPVAIRRVVPAAGVPTGASANPATTAGAVPGLPGAGTTGTGSATASTASATAGTGVPPSLAPLFVTAAGKYGLPVTLLTAVAYHESRYQTNAVSSAGAEGLMQIMPGTAAGLGITPFTPSQAIGGAAQLLSGYLHQFGSVPLALAAYNAGAGAVQQYGGIPPYPQTQAYVQTIMQQIGGVA